MQFNSYDYIYFLPVLVCAYFILNRIKFPQLLSHKSNAPGQLSAQTTNKASDKTGVFFKMITGARDIDAGNFFLGKFALIAGSCFFYAYGDVSVLKVLLISIAVNYIFTLLLTFIKLNSTHTNLAPEQTSEQISKRNLNDTSKRNSSDELSSDVKSSMPLPPPDNLRTHIITAFPVIVNVCILLYFKYTNFALENINLIFGTDFPLKDIILPTGISFFTFQQIAYVVSVYRGEINSSFTDYLAYILYFPKILMGPLAEPKDFFAQLNDKELKKPNANNIAAGIKLFSFGLAKKILLADIFANAVTWGFENVETATSMDLILVTLFYTFEIYFDFSGYTDMAVGSSLMLNITLPINFDSPYKALSIRDFWKRWHISLTSFFTKYVYIPLGGSRRGAFLTCLNTMFVFFVSGLWHGANYTFILWGLLHGFFSLLDRFTEKRNIKIFEPLRWILTFTVINVLWLLFRCDSISEWKHIVRIIFFMNDTSVSEGLIFSLSTVKLEFLANTVPVILWFRRSVRGLWMIGFTLVAFGVCLIPENNYRNKDKRSFVGFIMAAFLFCLSLTWLSKASVFVYFGF